MFVNVTIGDSQSIINIAAIAAIDVNPYGKDYPEVGVTLIGNHKETYDYVISGKDALAIMQAAQQSVQPTAANGAKVDGNSESGGG